MNAIGSILVFRMTVRWRMSHLLLLLPRRLSAFRSSSSSIVIQQKIIRTHHPSSSLVVRSNINSPTTPLEGIHMTTNANNAEDISQRRHNSTPLETKTTTAMLNITGQAGSLERLCSTSLQACQLLQPLIAAIYTKLGTPGSVSDNSSAGSEEEQDNNNNNNNNNNSNVISKAKADESAFTIADGLVQYLLIHVLYAHVKFRDVVGEEEEEEEEHEDNVNNNSNNSEQILLHGLSIPADLEPILQSTKQSIELLSQQYFSSSSSNYYMEYTIFIDPIDGTREFINRQGNQCTICIGIANTAGKAVGGVVYRPLSLPHPTWATGVQDEDYAICNFFGHDHDSTAAPYEGHHHHGGLLTTNGPISPFISQLITTLDMDRIKSGGAGNKMLLLLEHSLYYRGRGAGDRSSHMLYIQDRGVSRWDTCAAEAILYAFGGQLTKLTPYLAVDDDDDNNEVVAVKTEEDDSRRYKYLASTTNLDFIPGLASLTKNNCRRHDGTNTDFLMKGDQKIMNVEDVKVYSNLCGFVAFGPEWNTVDGKECIAKAIQKAAIVHPPSFN